MCFRPPSTSSGNRIICPNCGKSNSIEATVCEKCGAELEGVENSLPPSAPPQAPVIASEIIPGSKNLPRLSVGYPEFPGSAAVRTNLIGSSINDAALWRFLKKAVVARKEHIDCLYSSPVTALIQDPDTQAIIGVEIERDGKKLNIAARNGVVMALGGYENNARYTQQATDNPQMLAVGTLYNEGDGLSLASAVGARLWHMNGWQSGGLGLVPEDDRIRSSGDNIVFFKSGSVILVGGDGRRYIAEDAELRQGRVLVGGTWVIPTRPDRNIFVFDEAQRLAMASGTLPRPFPNWSQDLSTEIASGKVKKASTLWGIAEEFSLDTANLAQTVEVFNEAATSGVDRWGREAQNMTAFGEGPYYGVAVVPAVTTTQGGPERSARAEIIDEQGDTIPQLYAAGEFGSVMARSAQVGANLAECVIFGKIAGEEAAKSKESSFEPAVSGSFGPGSGDVSIYDQGPDESNVAQGKYVGIGEGLGGPLWVLAGIDGSDTLHSLEILNHHESEDNGSAALEELKARMLEAGSVEVDVIAGATVTSLGLKQAVLDAMDKKK